jgi:ABC-type nitrate/sulfonate/bicarbonate transport system substrate-binding protein
MSFRATRRQLLAGSLAAAALRGTALAAPARDVTYITPFGKIIAYAPDFIAVTNGYFEKNGLKVEIVGGTGSSQPVQLVVAGKALVGRTGGIDVSKAISASGVPVRAIATISHTSPFMVVSDPKKPIKSPADLKGKSIGIVSRGGATDNLLDIMLVGAGVDRDSVQRQVAGNSPGAWDLIERGRIDCFIVDESVVISLRKSGKDPLVLDINPYAAIPGQIYVASQTGIDEHRDELIGYLRAVREAVRFIIQPANMDTVLDRLKTFDLAELRNPDVARASIEAQAKLWLAHGEQGILRNQPENWDLGWHQLEAAGLVKAGDPKLAYTNDLVDAL